jgi:hypothetical protein
MVSIKQHRIVFTWGVIEPKEQAFFAEQCRLIQLTATTPQSTDQILRVFNYNKLISIYPQNVRIMGVVVGSDDQQSSNTSFDYSTYTAIQLSTQSLFVPIYISERASLNPTYSEFPSCVLFDLYCADYKEIYTHFSSRGGTSTEACKLIPKEINYKKKNRVSDTNFTYALSDQQAEPLLNALSEMSCSEHHNDGLTNEHVQEFLQTAQPRVTQSDKWSPLNKIVTIRDIRVNSNTTIPASNRTVEHLSHTIEVDAPSPIDELTAINPFAACVMKLMSNYVDLNACYMYALTNETDSSEINQRQSFKYSFDFFLVDRDRLYLILGNCSTSVYVMSIKSPDNELIVQKINTNGEIKAVDSISFTCSNGNVVVYWYEHTKTYTIAVYQPGFNLAPKTLTINLSKETSYNPNLCGFLSVFGAKSVKQNSFTYNHTKWDLPKLSRNQSTNRLHNLDYIDVESTKTKKTNGYPKDINFLSEVTSPCTAKNPLALFKIPSMHFDFTYFVDTKFTSEFQFVDKHNSVVVSFAINPDELVIKSDYPNIDTSEMSLLSDITIKNKSEKIAIQLIRDDNRFRVRTEPIDLVTEMCTNASELDSSDVAVLRAPFNYSPLNEVTFNAIYNQPIRKSERPNEHIMGPVYINHRDKPNHWVHFSSSTVNDTILLTLAPGCKKVDLEHKHRSIRSGFTSASVSSLHVTGY